MSVTTNKLLDVRSYKIDFNFVQSKIGSNDRVSVIILYGAGEKRLAELHFFPGYIGFAVSEQIDDHVDIVMSSEHFNDIYQMLRSEKPLGITFFRDGDGVLNNVWFGTSLHEKVGEEERRGIRLPEMISG